MVREALKIPVASNGGVSSYESTLRCLKETGCYLFCREGLKGVFRKMHRRQNECMIMPVDHWELDKTWR